MNKDRLGWNKVLSIKKPIEVQIYQQNNTLPTGLFFRAMLLTNLISTTAIPSPLQN